MVSPLGKNLRRQRIHLHHPAKQDRPAPVIAVVAIPVFRTRVPGIVDERIVRILLAQQVFRAISLDGSFNGQIDPIVHHPVIVQVFTRIE